MLNREVECELLPYCGLNGIGVVAYSPMLKGLLTGAITVYAVRHGIGGA